MQETDANVSACINASIGGFMKKTLLTGIVCLLGIFAFGQSAKYTELLNKAKKYDSEKNYAYALGYYYDAVREDIRNSKEAYDRFIEIENVLKDGKPGFDEYDDFTIYDEWVVLLKNAEKYWTEHAYDIYCCDFKLSQKNLDMETRTANYLITVTYNENRKYKRIIKIMTDGIQKSWTENWKGITFEEDSGKKYCSWPKSPVKGNSTDYKKDGVVTFAKKHYGYSIFDSSKIYEEDKTCSFAMENSMMSLDVELCAPDGRKIASVNNLYKEDIIKKIPQGDIKLFESGDVKVEVKGFNLYGGAALLSHEPDYKKAHEELEKHKLAFSVFSDTIGDYVNRYSIYESVLKTVGTGKLIAEYTYKDVAYDLLDPAEWDFGRKTKDNMLPAIVEKISALTGIKHKVHDYDPYGDSFSLKRELTEEEIAKKEEEERLAEIKRQEEEERLRQEKIAAEERQRAENLENYEAELKIQVQRALRKKGKLSKKQLVIYLSNIRELEAMATLKEMDKEQVLEFIIENLLQQGLIIQKGSNYMLQK